MAARPQHPLARLRGAVEYRLRQEFCVVELAEQDVQRAKEAAGRPSTGRTGYGDPGNRQLSREALRRRLEG